MLDNQIFIAWIPFQRRAVSLQPYFGYILKFIRLSFSQRYLRPLEYLFKTWRTLFWLIQTHPAVIWAQLPPTLLLHVLFFYKHLFQHSCIIVADCHNGAFRKPWVKIPGFHFFLKRCDLVLVHNNAVKQQAQGLGISSHQLYVLEDPPAVFDKEETETNSALFPEPWVLCPCSFNKDEPIGAILAAARLTPEITFVLSGNRHRAIGHHDISNVPGNVKLPGFLPTDEFDQLLRSATIIMGLTLLDGIQLSVASEAVGVGKPMVLANTVTLHKLFYKGTVYVNPDEAVSIAAGCKEAIKNHDVLTNEIFELRDERQMLWLQQAHQVKEILESFLA